MPDLKEALKISIPEASSNPTTSVPMKAVAEATYFIPDSRAEPEKPKQSLFLLYYRQGQNPHTIFTMFFGSGSFNQIVSTAKNYCETMNMRFVTVKPAIINFEEEMKKLNRAD